MSKREVLEILNELKNNNKISTQQYKTYRGQVFADDIQGCIVGLRRKKLWIKS